METNLCKQDCVVCCKLRAATLVVIAADGIDSLTIERLAAAAGISSDELTAHYADASSCLFATYEEASDSIYADFAKAFAVETGWRRALALGGRTLLERLASNPGEARLCFVEILRSDHELLRRRAAARQRLVDLFVEQLGRRRDHPEQFRVQLELLIGAGFQAIATAIDSGEVTDLPSLEPELQSRAFVFEPVPV